MAILKLVLAVVNQAALAGARRRGRRSSADAEN